MTKELAMSRVSLYHGILTLNNPGDKWFSSLLAKAQSSVHSIQDLRSAGSWFDPQANFFVKIDKND